MKRMYVTLAATALVGLGALLPATTVHGVTGPGTSTTGPNLSANTTVVDGQTVFVPDGDTPAKAKSTAEFTVQPGELQLVAVPDMNFGGIPIAKILNGGSQDLVDNTVKTDATIATSKNVTAFDGNSSGTLVVNDLRGTSAGWHLTTQLGPEFTSKTGPALKGITLKMTSTGTNQVAGTIPLSGEDIGSDQAIQVAIAAKDTGQGTTLWPISQPGNANLKIGVHSGVNIPAGAVYQSDITWTLVAGA
ncbi:MAG: WxL domain-containing protein [Schleiferilactobacillus perolens]|uniref:WxL domain-containing protein n=1 Tax=Schleiferilactobacillus perolens TaxID=100468 RepID=UPI0039E86741